MKREYPSDWDSRRKKVYQRDNYCCQNCRKSGGAQGGAELHAHHIVPMSKGGSNQLSNLQTLCKDCHNAIHHENKVAPTSRSRNKTDPKNDPPGPIVASLIFGSIFCLLLLLISSSLNIDISEGMYLFLFIMSTLLLYGSRHKWHQEYAD